ncbi:protoheme IX farnesyltransferase [Desulfopila sp. IMCC35008]|uniref:protoheme IX farnesyltransferase n=1 Tax=Desulfopila sp. IMCC35008 TaxID=2653858 RepID=UPI0013D774E0|nr:UbiA family prenyltransferase [Desulfopila sp. IMCC35008]
MHIITETGKLTKARLCLMVGLSAAFGFHLYGQPAGFSLAAVAIGVFLLACGGAALNSIQEKEYDATFERTRTRPLVTGSLSLPAAYGVAAITIGGGLILLWLCCDSITPMLIGVVALLVYNGMYTPLKPYTEFSLIPGGVSGALPPLIGWNAAGGTLTDPLIWAVMALFFLWQPPHFCLILLEYRDDRRKNKRYINLATRFSTPGVKKIISIWLFSFTTVALFFTWLPGLLSPPAKLALALAAPLFLAGFLYHLHVHRRPRYKLLFISLNSYLLCLMMLLTVGSTIQI